MESDSHGHSAVGVFSCPGALTAAGNDNKTSTSMQERLSILHRRGGHSTIAAVSSTISSRFRLASRSIPIVTNKLTVSQ